MALYPVNKFLRGVFARLLMILLISPWLWQAQASDVPHVSNHEEKAQNLLQKGLHFADLYNWADAVAAFGDAEKEFNLAGDKRNSYYSHLGAIRATSGQRNLPQTSLLLANDLKTNPMLKNKSQLRLFCLIVKGDIDQEIDSHAARDDWQYVHQLAGQLGDHRWENRSLAQIGIAAFYDGDLETASKNVGTAVEIATKTGDVGAQMRFTTVLGEAFVQAKMFAQALPYFAHADEIAKTVSDAGYQFVNNQFRMDALIGLKQFDAAQKLGDQMLFEAQRAKRPEWRAMTLILVAQVALAQGKVPTAIGELQQSIEFCKRSGLNQTLETPQGMLAQIYMQVGKIQQAEQFANAAAQTAQTNGDKWTLPVYLQTLAQLQVAEGKYVDADKTYDRASEFVDSGLANSSSVLEKTALIKASGTLYPEHFDLLVAHLHNPDKAYSIVEQVRGRVSTDLLMAGSRNSEKAKEVEHAISQLQLQMMAAKAMPEMNRLRDQIFTLQELRWVSPGVSILKHRAKEVVPVPLVRQSLDSNTAILEYVVAEPRSYCVVISRNGLRIATLPGEQQIAKFVTAYLKAVGKRVPAESESHDLFKTVLAPIGEIEQNRNLIIIRDGPLHLLPIDALENPSGGHVFESHVVAYAPSVTSYYFLRRDAERSNPSMVPLLAVGGIPYSQSSLRPIKLMQAEKDPTLRDLPNSKEEVLDANATLGGKNTLLLGDQATESAFKRNSEHRFGTIHIAAHGSANSPDPNDASLAFLPDVSAGEDGLLHASEIAMMHLHANLVVLSACDTAVGPIQGQEGIATLSNSFLLAGARSVVSTLWSVNDSSSLFLMQQFYLRIAAGDSPALALTMAKREMLRKYGQAALPYYWAGFTYEGATGLQHTSH